MKSIIKNTLSKLVNRLIVLLATPLLWSCGSNDEVLYLPEGDDYNWVYLIQSVDYPRTTQIFMLENEVQTTGYSAFYSGLSASSDINIMFEIDNDIVAAFNEANQTAFKIMPEGSYELETTQAVIPAGRSRTDLMKLKLYSFGYIEAFEEYLLPLVMKTNDAAVNKELSVIYYYISASYEPGKVPRREVNPNMVESKFFSYKDKCLLAINSAGDVLRYAYDASNETFDSPTTVQTGWDGIVAMSLGGANTIQALGFMAFGGSIITYNSNDDGTVLPDYGNYTSVVFGGLGMAYMPVGNGRHEGLLMVQQSNGALNYYGLNDSWTAYAGPQVITWFDFRIYKNIFFYGQDLVGITETGDMWIHKYSASDRTFSTSPTKIGSGWDDYTHVTAFGTTMLARDTDGKLWLYQFDLRGFWALKPL